jgi:DNA-binding response OmpR family regulator
MRRILLVDDDPAICTLLSRVLEDAGYTVESAPDGATGLAILAASPPDLLITDVVMPGLAGWSVFARARRVAPTLPIIVMSGVDTGLLQKERALGDQFGFLRKPFDIDHLLAIVARLLAGIPSDPKL